MTVNHSISIAAVLVGQLDDIFGQPFFIGSTLRSLALRGPVLTKRAAGPALGYAKLPPHMVDALPAT